MDVRLGTARIEYASTRVRIAGSDIAMYQVTKTAGSTAEVRRRTARARVADVLTRTSHRPASSPFRT